MLYEPRLLSASIGFIKFKSSISDHADQRRTSSRVNVVASVDVASQSRRRFQISRTSEENNLESYCCAAYQGHKKQIYHSSQRCTRLKTRGERGGGGGCSNFCQKSGGFHYFAFYLQYFQKFAMGIHVIPP